MRSGAFGVADSFERKSQAASWLPSSSRATECTVKRQWREKSERAIERECEGRKLHPLNGMA